MCLNMKIGILKETKTPISYPEIKRVGINNAFYSVAGTQDYLRKLAGIELQLNDFDI